VTSSTAAFGSDTSIKEPDGTARARRRRVRSPPEAVTYTVPPSGTRTIERANTGIGDPALAAAKA
jgi:hypothetical protein